jgi:hypothetical protein
MSLQVSWTLKLLQTCLHKHLQNFLLLVSNLQLLRPSHSLPCSYNGCLTMLSNCPHFMVPSTIRKTRRTEFAPQLRLFRVCHVWMLFSQQILKYMLTARCTVVPRYSYSRLVIARAVYSRLGYSRMSVIVGFFARTNVRHGGKVGFLRYSRPERPTTTLIVGFFWPFVCASRL